MFKNHPFQIGVLRGKRFLHLLEIFNPGSVRRQTSQIPDLRPSLPSLLKHLYWAGGGLRFRLRLGTITLAVDKANDSNEESQYRERRYTLP
jgi:hypothetical protein